MNSTIFNHQPPTKHDEGYDRGVRAFHEPASHRGRNLHHTKPVRPLQRKMLTVGAIGWTITAPTVLGAALGLWVDTLWPSHFSWFSMLLPLGLLAGCLAALFWSWQENP